MYLNPLQYLCEQAKGKDMHSQEIAPISLYMITFQLSIAHQHWF